MNNNGTIHKTKIPHAASLMLAACGVFMLITALTSCNSDTIGYTYSDYHCNLTIDNRDHLDPTLSSACNSLSPGVFCKIQFILDNGAKKYSFESNHNQSSTSLFTAKDDLSENNRRIGQNNGIIVGFGNLDNPPVFYAYDAQCPNCFDINALPVRSYPLTMLSTGIARCNRCKREYNMNTGGNVVSGGGKHLELYRAQTSGPNGVVQVY